MVIMTHPKKNAENRNLILENAYAANKEEATQVMVPTMVTPVEFIKKVTKDTPATPENPLE